MIEISALINCGVICRYCGKGLDKHFRGFPRTCTDCKIENYIKRKDDLKEEKECTFY